MPANSITRKIIPTTAKAPINERATALVPVPTAFDIAPAANTKDSSIAE